MSPGKTVDSRTPVVDTLRRRLDERLGRFLRRRQQSHLLDLLIQLDSNRWPAVIFGGAIRDLLLQPRAIPRDIDLVVAGAREEDLLDTFQPYCFGRTRFGGLRLKLGPTAIDLWPLASTWAIRTRLVVGHTFSVLPETTAFNVEAIAVQVVPCHQPFTRIYEHGFFDAIASRTLELNLPHNPFPVLTAIRALVFATRFDFKLGSGLATFVYAQTHDVSASDIAQVQLAHYGRIAVDPSLLMNDIGLIRAHVESSSDTPVTLPVQRMPYTLDLFEAHSGLDGSS